LLSGAGFYVVENVPSFKPISDGALLQTQQRDYNAPPDLWLVARLGERLAAPPKNLIPTQEPNSLPKNGPSGVRTLASALWASLPPPRNTRENKC